MQTIADGVQASSAYALGRKDRQHFTLGLGKPRTAYKSPLLHVKANSVVGKYVVLHAIHEKTMAVYFAKRISQYQCLPVNGVA